uniref:Uncharacterized protein n=1 Tax=Hippocampus comes TaxID=109280 RepID=A0A3Q3DXV9_HIPCM
MDCHLSCRQGSDTVCSYCSAKLCEMATKEKEKAQREALEAGRLEWERSLKIEVQKLAAEEEKYIEKIYQSRGDKSCRGKWTENRSRKYTKAEETSLKRL